jgi:hypothetical protein
MFEHVSYQAFQSTILDHKRLSLFVCSHLSTSVATLRIYFADEGVLNYQGENTLAVSVWAADSAGAKLDSLKLEFTAQIESSMKKVEPLPLNGWKEREGAY